MLYNLKVDEKEFNLIKVGLQKCIDVSCTGNVDVGDLINVHMFKKKFSFGSGRRYRYSGKFLTLKVTSLLVLDNDISQITVNIASISVLGSNIV